MSEPRPTLLIIVGTAFVVYMTLNWLYGNLLLTLRSCDRGTIESTIADCKRSP
jgi:hypothetical protein